MKRMRRLLLCFLILSIGCSFQVWAQSGNVSGTITDSDGYTVPGANVVVKGTTNGSISDLDGVYNLSNVPLNSVISFSFIGMKTSEVPYTGQSKINVKLRNDAIALDEVVAVGYEVKKKSVVTGAISSLNNEQIMKAKPTNAISALGGRVSGVTLMPASGQPGSVPKLVIRGIGTNGNSNPLYVIDGLPMSDMNSINPSDIASMEILKDATSTAIYGARGANGVVLITTRQGKKGKTELSYDGYFGWSSAQSTMDMMNTKQYSTIIPEFYQNAGQDIPAWFTGLNTSNDTDWVNDILETAPVTEHNVTATLGSEKGSTLLSVGYLDQNGIMGGDKSFFKRYSARMNNIYEINKFIKVGANLNYNYIDRNGVAGGTNGWNPMTYALVMDPTTPSHSTTDNVDTFGYPISPVPFSRMWNPYSFMEVTSNGTNHTQRFYGNAFAEITMLKDLVFKSDIGVNLYNNDTRSFAPKYEHGTNMSTKNTVTQASNSSSFWQWENTLRYKKSFGKHTGSILLGTTASQEKSEYMNASRNNYAEGTFDKSNYWYLSAGDVATMANASGASPEHNLYSIFGRLSYNYDEKYMAEVVLRRDGSSNFGSNNQYATFPGLSLGWNISREDFWNIKNFDSLKLRASWGQNGNEAISAFSYTSIISNNYKYPLGENQTIYTGSAPESLVNPNVKWETSEQLDLGADMMFFGGKLTATVDFYTKTTKDLLMRPTLEMVRGNEAAFFNVGEIRNAGFEMQVGYNEKIGEVDFSASVNASYLKNEVKQMVNDNSFIEGGLWRTTVNITRMETGFPMGYFNLYKTNGIFQNEADVQNYKSSDGTVIQPDAQPGDFKWKDSNDDGLIGPDDRTNCGNPWPKWTMGATFSAAWRGFDLSVFLRGKFDYKLYSAQLRNEGYGRANLPVYYMDRWTNEGMNKGVPRLTMDDKNENFIKPSDFYLYDASFIKIGNIELGYSFPIHWLKSVKIQKARIYFSMDNVATFTDYPYLDPEVGTMDNLLDTGLDYGMYPQSRATRVGLSLTF